MLQASPTLVVHSFDVMDHNYSRPVADLLKTVFGQRFVLHPGNSRETVPQWASELQSARGNSANPAASAAASSQPPCDMVLVDGDHRFAGALADLTNMRNLAAPAAPIIVDDTSTDPGVALKSLVRAGTLRVRENYGPYDAPSRFNQCLRTYNRGVMCLPWGFSVAVYT